MLHSSTPTKEIVNGNVPLMLNFDVNFDDADIASSAAAKKYTINASASRPVLLRSWAEVITAFNAATTNVLTLGTTTSANELLASGDITEGTPAFYPTGRFTGTVHLVADTDIYVKYDQGVAQVETAVVVEDTPGTLTAGNATLTFTSALTGVLSIVVALATNDTEAQVATKFRAGLNANSTFATHFVASGATTNVVMTARVAAANDGTLNLAYADTTSAGLTDDATSNNTTAGAAQATTGKAKFYLELTPLF